MNIVLMLGWWYTSGWQWLLQKIDDYLRAIGHIFAVKVLFRTWFSPWKQIYSKSTFRTFFRDAIDNAVSRGIGAVVRGTILFWALILSILVLLAGLISIAVWAFIPLLVFILPALAIWGIAL